MTTRAARGIVERPRWATMLLTASAMIAFFDISRVVFPSIAFVFGRAGSTPAAEMGLFALLLFSTAGLFARASGINAGVAAPIMLVATVVARVAIVASPGGTTQLLASSLGLVAVVGLLGALAASDLPVREAARGLSLGLVVSLTIHTMLGTHDSVWVGGGIGWLVTITVVGGLLYGWFQARPATERPEIRTTVPWLLVGPVIAFQGVAASTPGAIRSGLGEGAVLPAVLLVSASALGYLSARLLTSSVWRESSGVIVLLPAALTAVLLIGFSSPGVAAVGSLLASFLATLAVAVSGEAADDLLASRGRRSAAPAAGMIFAFLIVFGYYASYELVIGFPRGLLPASAALLIAIILYQFDPTDLPDPRPSRDDVAALAFAPFLVLFVVMASQVRLLPPPFDATIEDVRVMTWNVHMGYDDQGRFNPIEIADIIGQQRPDIVVLNEIDRGWLLSGGHDLLEILADELQLDHVFGPAADAIWGNAILSRHPISDVVNTILPGDAAMDRGMLQATVDIGGAKLGIIATHLHHLDDGDEIRLLQTERLAEAAESLQLLSIPVLVMGDFNVAPDSGVLAPMNGFVDLVAAAGDGSPVPTFPSTGPVAQIDHIFGSRGIRATALDVIQTTASDHLPIALTVDAG